VLAILAIALATLWPMPGPSTPWSFCLLCGTRGTADFLLNVALFMPLGAALTLRQGGRDRRFVVLFGMVLSITIELSQFVIPGRDPSVRDVLSNTIGTFLGSWIVAHASAWVLPEPLTAARLCRVATAAAAVVCLTTGLLLAPDFPPTPYYGLWTPQLGHLESYHGRVLDARLGQVRIESTQLPAQIRDVLDMSAAGGDELRVRAIAGPPPPVLVPLVAIFDDHGREVLLLGVKGDELVFRRRFRAQVLRLDRPDVRIRMLQKISVGDTLVVNVGVRRGRYVINGIQRGFTVGSGWALLAYPGSLPYKSVVSAIWLAVLFLPAGFWYRTRRDAVVIAFGLLTALLVVPAITPLLPTPPLQWLGALAGLGFGALASARRALFLI
jgi:hypothetical protein